MESWVTIANDDAECWSSLALIQSLMSFGTQKCTTIFTGTNVSNEMRFLLGQFYDLVQTIPVGFEWNSHLGAHTPWTKCAVLESNFIFQENADEVFKCIPSTENSCMLTSGGQQLEITIWIAGGPDARNTLQRFSTTKIVRASTQNFDSYFHLAINKMLQFDEKVKASLSRSCPISPLEDFTSSNDTSEQKLENAIAIVGMGCRFPGANNLEDFWDILANGKYTVRRFPEERPTFDIPGIHESVVGFLTCAIDEFDAAFFGIRGDEAWAIDPQQRLLLEVAWEGLEDAGIDADTIRDTSGGVFVGNLLQDYDRMIPENELVGIHPTIRALGNNLSALSSRISRFFGLKGPSVSHEAGCSSGLGAVHLACESILRGECNMAIAGAVNLVLLPRAYNTAVLSNDFKCKTFDESADGFVSGEAVGTLVLKRYEDAIKSGDRIRAIIRGTAMSNDGASLCYGTPNPDAHARTHKLALAKAGVQPKAVSYVETHGTGTQKGDIGEVFGLAEAYGGNRKTPLLIGSVKQNIGHGEAAAAMGSAIKLILSLQKKAIPPNIFLSKVNSKIDLKAIPAQIPTKLTPWTGPGRLAGLSSFSLTGSLVHAILQATPKRHPIASTSFPEGTPQLICISAKCEPALKCQVQNYLEFFRKNVTLPLADVAMATNFCRTHFAHRIALVVCSMEDLIQKLDAGNYESRIVTGTGDSLQVEMPEESDSHILNAYLKTIGERYLKGGNLNWAKWFGRREKSVFLPFYPFQRQKFWFSPTQFPAVLKKRAEEDSNLAKIHPLLGYRIHSPVAKIYQMANFERTKGTSIHEILEILFAAASCSEEDQMREQVVLESISILEQLTNGATIQTTVEPVKHSVPGIENIRVYQKCLDEKEWKLIASAILCNNTIEPIGIDYKLATFEVSNQVEYILNPRFLEMAVQRDSPCEIKCCALRPRETGNSYFQAKEDGRTMVFNENKKCLFYFQA